MTELWDNPRPDGYWPGTPSQWREATVDDCTWYATEFAFEAASETHRSVHPVKGLREYSTDTSGGTPVSVAIRDTSKLWPRTERVHAVYGQFHRDYLERCLQQGAVLVLGGDYEKLPVHYRKWTINDKFDHAVACKTYRLKPQTDIEQTFLYDPLGGGSTLQPYDGEWITLDALLDNYTWAASSGRIWAGIVMNKGDEPMRSVNLFSQQATDKEVRCRSNTEVRVEPRIDGRRTRTIWGSKNWFSLIGTAANGWRLIGWNLDADRSNIGYIHKDDIAETRTVEPAQSVDSTGFAKRVVELEKDNAALVLQVELADGIMAQNDQTFLEILTLAEQELAD